MTEEERFACVYLPENLSRTVVETMARWNKPISEIRLRKNGPLSLTLCGKNGTFGAKNVLCGVTCTAEEVARTVEKLCGGSLYSHSESIREGVIVTDRGIRAGVCGRAVIMDGKIMCVREISSVNIRIPHRVVGAADQLYEIVKKYGSTLLCSQPGMGKTTMLRELIPLLSKGENAAKVAVIDSRYELCAGLGNIGLCDIYSGWTRYDGMISAIRTMTPDYIICDEISDDADVKAVTAASAAGVKVIASAHGKSLNGIRRNPNLHKMTEEKAFNAICGISEDGLEIWETADD